MSIDMPAGTPLNEDTASDVCIVGGGITGLTTAYRLLQEGKSVIVLESGTLCSGMTSLTTAHLSNVIDRGVSTIERLHGEEGARLAVGSRVTAFRWSEETAAKESVACDFERGWTDICSPPQMAQHAESKKNGKPFAASGRPTLQPVLRRRQFFQVCRLSGCEIKNIAWFHPDGLEKTYEDWHPRSVCVWPGMPSKKKIIKGAPYTATSSCLFKAHHELLPFTPPVHNQKSRWKRLLDTIDVEAAEDQSSWDAARRIISTLGRSPCWGA